MDYLHSDQRLIARMFHINRRLRFAFLSLLCLIWVTRGVADDHAWKFESVQGNQIAWSCEGSGLPTIVLIAGGGLSAHDSFAHTYHNYKGRGTICMYDRAGMGRSSFEHPTLRGLDALTDELHQLVAKRSWKSLVLVAHSFGGYIARAYASQYPSEVKGLLLADVGHEDWIPALQKKMSRDDWAIMAGILEWNSRTFHEDYLDAQETVRHRTIPRSIPLTVVSRGIPHTQPRVAKISYAGLDLFNAEHDALQPKLLGLSDHSEQRIAKYASHRIDDFDPWLLIEEIEKLVVRSNANT